jgi:Uma2 family endonuclease
MVAATIPPLENGDRLDRFEFERRYEALLPSKKVELINGIVYMAAALRYRSHGLPHSQIMTWLGFYVANTPGVELADNITVRLDLDNEPQPDVLLRIETECGGQSRISDDDYVEGAPELIVEIAGSTVSYDLHDKLQLYRRHGVKEYIVWRVYDRQIDWFYLEQGQYVPLLSNDQGSIKSRIFPGLVLPIQAMLKSQLVEVLAQQQAQLQTECHKVYCKQLQASRH